MAELGYIEGKNIVYIDKEMPQTATSAESQAEVKKFIDDKVDLILTFPTPMVFAAWAATKGTDIPVVFAMANLEGTPLVESVRKPGGNMTGVRNPGPEVLTRRMEIILEIAPDAKRIWVGYDKNHPNTPSGLEALRPAAQSLGVTLVEVPAAALGELQADLDARAQSTDPGIDAILTMSDGLNQGPEGFAMLCKFALEHKIPLGAGVLSMVKQGALFGNSPEMIDVGKLAAPLADKIFKGTPPGTISVLTPEQDLYINLKEAERMGLKVPETLLQRAKEIVQ
ncbi:MAG: ABC transporter substrate-binding protein [Spirochaetales bacterium]|nr:ABC transporter substrate-binding protein [Spirochaetales bacterium]